jgi:hypothetical protein
MIEVQSHGYNTTSAEDVDVANAVFLIKGLITGLLPLFKYLPITILSKKAAGLQMTE